MMRKFVAVGVLAVLAAGFAAGCSASSAGVMGMNLMRDDSNLKIYLDNTVAKQNTVKKAATGYSRFDVKDPVATSPTLKFEIEKPDKFGRITMVAVNIYQKFEADYSNQAEYTIVANSQDPGAQMKPGVAYNLSNPGPGFRVMDLSGREVSGVTLQPGVKYMLSLTVKADKSETGQVYFETK